MKTTTLSLLTIMSLSAMAAEVDTEQRDRIPSVKKAIQSVSTMPAKEVSVVDDFRHMFADGKVTGQVRSMYSGIDNKNATDTSATAIGGQLKYELAEFNGFNAAAGFTTTHDIGSASGDGIKRNDGLSGGESHYTELTEAYINYAYKDLNLRAGRQLIDTPLADRDDIRMVPNTFEAYTATFEIDAFSLMAGHLLRWQGVDAGLDDGWVKTGKDGVSFGGISYANDFIDASAWYYNVSNTSTNDIAAGADENGNNSVYLNLIGHFDFNDNISLDAGVQYLNQDELDNSNVKATIYGAMAELVVYDLGINVAYNSSSKQKGKHSFSGYGGGALFTSMDTMIIDEITEDRDANSFVTGLSYSISDFNLLYAYGNFSGDKDSTGAQAHIVEQNIGVEYTPNDDLTLGAIFVIDKNKEDSSSTDFNNNNFRILASYNF